VNIVTFPRHQPPSPLQRHHTPTNWKSFAQTPHHLHPPPLACQRSVSDNSSNNIPKASRDTVQGNKSRFVRDTEHTKPCTQACMGDSSSFPYHTQDGLSRIPIFPFFTSLYTIIHNTPNPIWRLKSLGLGSSSIDKSINQYNTKRDKVGGCCQSYIKSMADDPVIFTSV
jgi:hypothetical protein